MLDIQTLITQNFEQNIHYLQQKHSALYKKLSEYESAVEKGLYQEKYELIYEEENFDVQEYATDKKLYNLQSKSYAQMATKSISLKPDSDCFSSTIEDQALASSSLLTLQKFIFFGSGLALHISTITETFSLKTILIIEDDLELFRLSLFTTNYAQLAQKSRLFFSIFEDTQEFLHTSEQFLEYQHYYNGTIKFFTMLSHSDAKVKEFQLALSTQAHLTFLHKDMLEQLLLPIINIKDGYQFLTKEYSLEGIKKPFILLGAGPSLDKEVKMLQKHQENFIVVAVSATLAYLEAQNIRVDIMIHLDAFNGAHIHFEKIKERKYFSKTFAFVSAKTSQNILNYFSKENIFMFEDTTHYKQNSLKLSAPCVGSLSYQLLLLLKVEKLYLLGIDLSVDKESGATHSSTHTYKQTLDVSKRISDEEQATYKNSLLSIQANRGGTTLTTLHFLNSINAINLTTHYLKKTEVYNLSNGAKLEDIEATTFPTSATNSMKSTLIVTGESFTQADTEKIQDDLKSLQTTLPTELKYSSLEKLIAIDDHFADAKYINKYAIYKVINIYLRTTLPTLFDRYNHQDVYEKDFQVVQKKLYNEISGQVSLYTQAIKELL